MKQLPVIICLLLIMSVAGSVNAQARFVHTQGREIVDASGHLLLLKGTNLGNWLVPEGYMFRLKNTNSPRMIHETIVQLIGPEAAKAFWNTYLENYVTAADIHYLKSIGANSIRIPFNYRLFTNEDYLGSNDAGRGFRLLDKVIGWCKKEQLYVILDMHCAPGGQTGDNIDDSWGYPFLFESKSCRQLTIDIWKKIAQRYSNEEIVIGYDLLNEPIAHYFDIKTLNPLLEPFYKDLIKEVRSVDKNHIMFLGGAQWDTNFKVFGQPFDSNVVYTFHKYGNKPDLGSIQRFIDFSDKYNVPVYAGETGENTDEWIIAFRKVLEEHNIGWHFWPYKKMESPKNILCIKVPAAYDSLVQYAEAPRNSFKDIRKLAPLNRIAIKDALDEVLHNCLFEQCSPNNGYIKALGFTPTAIKEASLTEAGTTTHTGS